MSFYTEESLPLSLRRLLRESPEDIYDAELVKIRLKTLSTNIGDLFKLRIGLTYIRWLEVQRQAPRSPLNQQWSSVVGAWAIALWARGFTFRDTCDLVEEFSDRFKKQDPAGNDVRPAPNRRSLTIAWNFSCKTVPTRAEIKEPDQTTSVDNSRPSSTNSSILNRQQSAESYTHPFYICNRCSRRDHHVSDCPTNLDPKYDRAPASHYCCIYCGSTGTHYSSFCKENPHPHSINQQRQRMADNQSNGKAGCVTGTAEFEPMRLRDEDKTETSKKRTFHEYSKPEYGRLSIEFPDRTQQRGKENKRLSTQYTADFEPFAYQTKSPETMKDFLMTSNKDMILLDSEEEGEENEEAPNTYSNHPYSEKVASIARTPAGSFLLNLFKHHPEAYAPINRQSRISAMEIWEENDRNEESDPLTVITGGMSVYSDEGIDVDLENSMDEEIDLCSGLGDGSVDSDEAIDEDLTALIRQYW